MAFSISKLKIGASIAFGAPAALALFVAACSSDDNTGNGGTDSGAGGSTGGSMGSTGGSKSTGGQGGTGGSTDAGTGGKGGTGGSGTGGTGGCTEACAPLSLDPPDRASTNTDGGPSPIAVPAGAHVVKHFLGKGTQNYTCLAKAPTTDGGATTYAWSTASVPQATLFQGACAVGTHFAGPTWEFTLDQSTVKGSKVAALAQSGTIPWLLLKAIAHGGPDGSVGVFSNVTFIQRVNTTGGTTPTATCDATKANSADPVAKVDYTADYFFFEGGVGDGGP